MSDDDASVGSILFAIKMILRAANWRVEHKGLTGKTSAAATPSEGVQGGTQIKDPETAVHFLEGVLFDDMSHTWDDFISQTLSMLPFGWQYSEIVFKKRNGDQPEDGDQPSSSFDDGLIGIHKLADRSQESLDRWDVDVHGNVFGLYQQPPNGGSPAYIPIGKALHFRPESYKDSPEGRSILRTAYRSWYFMKTIQEIEAIAIERELNGLPVVYIPNAILNGTSAEAKNAVAKYTKMVRDIKFNEQGGAVLPSDPFMDGDGMPSSMPQVRFDLVNAGGSRAIDTNKTIIRYQSDIARTVLAQFLYIGSGDSSGGYAQSRNESDLFLRACSGWLESIAATINRQLIPKIWKINALDPALMPYIVPGSLSPENLAEIGDFVQKLAAAGILLLDDETVNYLRGVGGLPENAENNDSVPVVSFSETDGTQEPKTEELGE